MAIQCLTLKLVFIEIRISKSLSQGLDYRVYFVIFVIPMITNEIYQNTKNWYLFENPGSI